MCITLVCNGQPRAQIVYKLKPTDRNISRDVKRIIVDYFPNAIEIVKSEGEKGSFKRNAIVKSTKIID